jgi:endonuclease YncB( thermonuclease family)
MRLPPSSPCRRRFARLLGAVACVAHLAALPWSAQAQAPGEPGSAQRVVDGDSLWWQPRAGGKPVEVRLQGIDAPEACQAWGPEAAAALRERVMGTELALRRQGKDDHGRVLGVLSAAGRNLNAELVQEGHAWSMRYRWDQGPYVKEERQAIALKRGLHEQRGAELPRDFRKRHGPCQAGQGVAAGPSAASSTRNDVPVATTPSTTPAVTPVAPARSGFRCDGRTHCAQMRSCEEARFFLANCPNAQMDGNRDGVPCERQWCTR